MPERREQLPGLGIGERTGVDHRGPGVFGIASIAPVTAVFLTSTKENFGP